MHDSARPHGTLNRRRFLSISGQSLLAFSLSQLIPVNLLAEERLPDLPDGLLRMGRDVFPHEFISDHHYVQPLLGLMDEQPPWSLAAWTTCSSRRARPMARHSNSSTRPSGWPC